MARPRQGNAPNESESVWHNDEERIDDLDNEGKLKADEDEMLTRSPIYLLPAGLFLLRLCNCFLVQSSFVPDEYWQSLEVAHHLAFGSGHLTWEWQVGIRGSLYPIAIAALYRILALLHLDSALMLIWAPRVFQAALAAAADWSVYQTARNLIGPRDASWVLAAQLSSWFTWYCATRTLANSVEWALLCVALPLYPWKGSLRHGRYCFPVVLAILIRPTAILPWIPLIFRHLWLLGRHWMDGLGLFLLYGLPGFLVSLLVDRMFYGQWVVVQLSFLGFNVGQDLGSFYGTHPWHWYLSQGVPIVLGPFLPAVLFGLSLLPASPKRLLCTPVCITILAYSCVSHKEFRFLFPLLPFCMIACGRALRWFPRGLSILLLIGNVALAVYTGLIHQRGVLDVMSTIRGLCPLGASSSASSVLFLTPCHATPFYSHIHCPLSMRFLECPPPLLYMKDNRDEAAEFYVDPKSWLEHEFQSSSLPTHVVLFNTLEEVIGDFLTQRGYSLLRCHFHTHFPEARTGSHICVYEQQFKT
uniref:GPI mannosyltransferase 3-like isoform X2 n=1 Tax=Myxine glutinosa TaxID=7769 RepID=UPI00358E75BB